MGFFEEAVDLCIEKGFLDYAKNYANKPKDE